MTAERMSPVLDSRATRIPRSRSVGKLGTLQLTTVRVGAAAIKGSSVTAIDAAVPK
jgi:hypothetical protein